MPGRALKVCGGAVKDYMVLKGTLVSALSFAQTEQYVLENWFVFFCQNPMQLNLTQSNSKATSVGVRYSSHVFPTTNFSATPRPARELKFGTETH